MFGHRRIVSHKAGVWECGRRGDLTVAGDRTIDEAAADRRLLNSDRSMARKLALSAEDAAHALGRFRLRIDGSA